MNAMKIKNFQIMISITFSVMIALNLFCCKASQAVLDKSGAQLWGENCQRCHFTPTPASFSADQWETIGMHMQTRALITEQERKKIVTFLQLPH
jgi:hypothetical protein